MEFAPATVEHTLRALLSAKLSLDCSRFSGSSILGDLGFDSESLSDLADTVDESFDVRVENSDLNRKHTIDDLIAMIHAARKSRDITFRLDVAEGAD